MKINIRNIYPYKDLKRNDDETRTYETRSGQKLASVTSILRLTQPEEKRRGLNNWRQRIGKKKADAIVKQSSLVGTSLHKHLEHYVLGKNYIDDTDIGRIARPMAKEITDKGPSAIEIIDTKTSRETVKHILAESDKPRLHQTISDVNKGKGREAKEIHNNNKKEF